MTTANAPDDQLDLPLEPPAITVFNRREDREIRLTPALCGMQPERFRRAMVEVTTAAALSRKRRGYGSVESTPATTRRPT